MSYSFTCPKCGQTKELVAQPRGKTCVSCKGNSRRGTGRKDRGNTRGYRMIYVGKRRVYEHRYVMELLIGRPLRRNEHVHHIDGDRINNAVDNLELISASDHARLHMTPARSAEMNEIQRKSRLANGPV